MVLIGTQLPLDDLWGCSGIGQFINLFFLHLLTLFQRTTVAPLIHRVSGAVFKMYRSEAEARQVFDRALEIGAVEVV